MSSQHIFLLSHMRANTSLVSHILGSHPQISGYYEMHLSYHDEHDLDKQLQLFSSKDQIKSSTKYMFDKLLHNDYELCLDQLDRDKIKILVSIRSPEQSIKSIVNLFRNKNAAHAYAGLESAAQYYIDRVTELARFCQCNKGQYYYYDADLIRIQHESLLQRLQDWLGLSMPLSEQYQLFSLTGQARVGDTSENMNKGRIVRHQNNYDDIEIPDQLLRQVVAETRRHKEAAVSYAIDSIELNK